MSDRQRLLFLILILAVVTLFTTGVTNYFLYNAAFEQNRERLSVTARSQAGIMEAVARFDQLHSTDYPNGATAATISQIAEAHDNFELFGETGEFVIARREKDQIVFLSQHWIEIPFKSAIAEPMRQALLGRSGTLVGLDYWGETVLAAFEPVAVLNLGVVAKIDLTEIRAPFARVGIITGIFALLAILAGAFLFVRTTNPMLRRIQESEAKYRDLVETSQDLIWRVDREGRFVYLNPAWESTLGYSLEEMDGQMFTNFRRPDEAERALQAYKQVLQSGSATNYETSYISKSGKEIIFNFKGKPLLDAAGQIVGAQGTAMDITERKRAEEDLKNSQRLLQTVFDTIPIGAHVKDRSGRYLMVNPSMAALYGQTPHDVVGKAFAELGVGTETQKEQVAADDRRVIETGKTIDFPETPLLLPDGETIWRRPVKAPLRDDTGTIIGIVGVMEDTTKRRQQEEQIELQRQQLIQADKLATLGTLVAGVAHEINNPNNSISLNAPLMTQIWEEVLPILDKYREEAGDFTLGRMTFGRVREEMPKLLRDIVGGSRRIRDIVEKLKNFARIQQRTEYQAVGINEVVDSAVVLLAGLIKKRTNRLDVECAAELPLVRGNFQEIEQVVINLISNACEALPDRERGVRVSTSFDSETGRVLVEVADEGEGISPENLNKIMDPFFTTKRDKGGTGLGLSVSFNIAHQHGGVLDYSSSLGRGTVATLKLPAMH